LELRLIILAKVLFHTIKQGVIPVKFLISNKVVSSFTNVFLSNFNKYSLINRFFSSSSSGNKE